MTERYAAIIQSLMTSNLNELATAQLPTDVIEDLRHLGAEAEAAAVKAYLVGGSVRDLLMGAENLDIDVALEGDVKRFIRSFASKFRGRLVVHERFGTATLQMNNRRLDLAMARTESYKHPGALPEVKPGTIQQDLYRRDFTINAMAMSIAPASFGRLLDPFKGANDIRNKKVKVLHDLSFVDDPTRMVRAVRYEQRFDFSIESHTLGLLKKAKAGLSEISGDRARHELERILEEREPEKSFARMYELGLLAYLIPGLNWGEDDSKKFVRIRRASGERTSFEAYMATVAWGMSRRDVRLLEQRLRLPQKARTIIEDVASLKDFEGWLSNKKIAESGLYEKLRPFSMDSITVFEVCSTAKTALLNVKKYKAALRFLKPFLNGRELMALGVPQGPAIGQVLLELLRKRLDGRLTSREEERDFVKQWLKSTQAS